MDAVIILGVANEYRPYQKLMRSRSDDKGRQRISKRLLSKVDERSDVLVQRMGGSGSERSHEQVTNNRDRHN